MSYDFKINPDNLSSLIHTSVADERNIYPCHVNRASEIGHPCVRYLYLSRKRWADRQLPEVALQFIFNEGNLHEESVFERLRKAGFIITETQRSFHDKNLNISGHIDGFIRHSEEIPAPIPLEVKGLSANNWGSINSYADMVNHKQYYVRKYPAQIQTYMYLSEIPFGLFVLKNKQTGKLKFIVCDIDYDYVEGLLKKIEKVNKLLTSEEIPDETTEEVKICQSCPFNHICFKDKDDLPGVVVMEDVAIEEGLKKLEELEKAAEEYKAVKEDVSEALKVKAERERGAEGVADILIGDFVCKLKKGSTTKYELPDDVKEKYAKKSIFWKWNGFMKVGQ